MKKLEAELAAKDAKIKELTDNFQKRESELAAKDAKITELSANLPKRESEIAALLEKEKARASEMEKKHFQDVKELAERLQLRNAENDAKTKEIAALKAEIDALKSSYLSALVFTPL